MARTATILDKLSICEYSFSKTRTSKAQLMNGSKTSLSTVLILSIMTSFTPVKAQENTTQQCLEYYRKQTMTLKGEPIEKSRWYKDRNIGFQDWRDPDNFSFTVRDNFQADFLKNEGFDVRYYTNGIYYTVALNPSLEVPKYSEQEIIQECP